MNINLDEIDKRIVDLLISDADTTNRDIAKSCNVALGTVNNRIQRLKANGILKKKTVVVDYEKLGYMIEVLITLRIKAGNFAGLADKLSKDANVFMVMDLSANNDAEVLARFYKKSELDTFVKKLSREPSVESIRTRLILNVDCCEVAGK